MLPSTITERRLRQYTVSGAKVRGRWQLRLDTTSYLPFHPYRALISPATSLSHRRHTISPHPAPSWPRPALSPRDAFFFISPARPRRR